MRQSRIHSLFEVLLNTLTGFAVSVGTAQLVFPDVSFAQNVRVVLIFTVVSVIRSYIWRRIFDYIHHRKHTRQANVLSA